VARIAQHVTIGTTNNGFSESLSSTKTLIPKESPLFKKVAAMSEAQSVAFDGYFARPKRTACGRQASRSLAR